MSAAILREAAASMRARAESASAGDWAANGGIVMANTIVPFGAKYIADCFDEPGGSVADAAHIASWHPSIALMVADLLEALAHQPNWHEHDNCPDSDVKACCAAAARVLSRAYLGGAA